MPWKTDPRSDIRNKNIHRLYPSNPNGRNSFLSFFSFLQLCQAKTVAFETSDVLKPKRIVKWSKGLLTHLLNPTEIKVGFCPKLRFLICLIETHLILLFFCASLCLSTKGGGGISVPKICQHLALKITRPLYSPWKEVSDLIMVLLPT